MLQQVRPVGSRGRQRTRTNFTTSLLPQLVRDGLNELATGALHVNSADDFVNLLLQRADHILAAELGVKHSFGRRFTAMEFTISACCSFYVHRQTCYRAEGFFTVLKSLLIVTDGGKINLPSYFVYDTACAFLYYLANRWRRRNDENFEIVCKNGKTYTIRDIARFLVRALFFVDPFHHKSHKHEGEDHVKEFSENDCNPTKAHSPRHRHMFINLEEGKRLANFEAQEQQAKFVGQFQKMIRSYGASKAEMFMYAVQSINREKTFAKLLHKRMDPYYHGHLNQDPLFQHL